MGEYANRFMSQLVAKNPGEPEFHQAVHEVAGSVELVLERTSALRRGEDLRADGASRSAC